MAQKFTSGRFKSWLDSGLPNAAGRLYTYASGTTTFKAAFTDSTLATPCTYTSDGVGGQYIALNARGEAQIWLGTGAYTMVDATPLGVVLDSTDGVQSAETAMSGNLANPANGFGADLVGGVGRVVNTVAAVRALLKTGVGKTFVLGYYAPGDGGGGQYYYDSTDTTSTDNGGTIIVASDGGRWKLVFTGTVSVKQFGAKGIGVAFDDSTFIQAAVNWIVGYAQGLTQGGSVIEPLYVSTPYLTLDFPMGNYYIAATNGVTVPANTYLANLEFSSSSGANIIGNGTTSVDGTNTGFNFNGGARKNIFKKLFFLHFGTAVVINTSNANECMVQFDSCEMKAITNAGIDTVSYAASRSTMVHLKNCFFGDTPIAIKHYTDHLTVDNCWFYAKKNSLPGVLYLSGDGMVSINSSFFIPHGVQVSPVANARWIDLICDTANSAGGDRSVKSLNIKNCRMSLESARPFVWFSDNNAPLPSGANQVCSITIEDTYVGGTGGNPVVTYIKGYPGSVNLRNVKGLACPHIVDANATGSYGGVANATYPVPSVPGTLTSHVIMIDEPTRLAQSNSNNASSFIDPLLEPFCYDTTSQTSKFKRSIPKNIDYRLPAVAAAGAGAGFVKATIPVFFDTAQGAPNRDILSFLLVTVSDADGPANSQPHERAQAVSLVTIVGGNSGTAAKRLITTVLQDAKGGTSYTVSAVPTVFWGQGDTGSADVAPGTAMGAATNITFAWFGRAPASAWAYIVPLAGMRENQQPLMQSGVW